MKTTLVASLVILAGACSWSAEPLPKLARLPVLMRDKAGKTCDCGPDTCCCEPYCKCPTNLGEAIDLAKAKDKPLVIYVNATARPVEGAIHVGVKRIPNFNLRVGVVLAVPRGVPGKGVEYYEDTTFDNTVSEARILEAIRDWRKRREMARGFAATQASFPFFQRSPYPTYGGSPAGCVEGR